jgi:hypothetical protein
VSAVRRWPLHPQPGPLESLSSWLERLARLYEMSVKDLLTRNLGLVDLDVRADLDYDPPMAILTALAERAGVELAQLRAMMLAGWQPWLFDKLTVPIKDTQPMFDAYVRGNSVLLAPGEAGTNQVNRWKRWPGPWVGSWPLHRACPVCAADPGRGRTLLWRLPLMTGCVEHGCRLEDATTVELQVTLGGEGPDPVPLEEPLATVDRYTYEGLTTGRVTLPGRNVHAGVWFRLLRCLLDEVSLSLSGRTSHGRATLEQVWQAAGLEERAGLTTWRPYEHLKPASKRRCCTPPVPPCSWLPMGPSLLSAASPPHCGRSTGTSTTATGPPRTAAPGKRPRPRSRRPLTWRGPTPTPPGSS